MHKKGALSPPVRTLCCCGGWCYFSGFCILFVEKLQCKKLPADSVSLCSVMQTCPEGRGIRRGGRDVGGTTELSSSLLGGGGGGVTFSSNALGCVVVNWGNNSLLNKTYRLCFLS